MKGLLSSGSHVRGRNIGREAITLRLRVHAPLIRRGHTTTLTQEFTNVPCFACSINACNVSKLSLFKRDFIYENLQVPYHAARRAFVLYLCLQVDILFRGYIRLAPFFPKRCLIGFDETECCALISCFGRHEVTG